MEGRLGSEFGIGEVKKKAGRIVNFTVLLVTVGTIIAAAYWPVLSSRALLFDDDQYLVENRLVQNPSWDSAKRFFGEVFKPSTVRGYYQPLTMVSLMADAAMGGGVDNLRPFHRTNLCLHVANSLLVVVLLCLLFGRAIPAAMAGVLYGVHPMMIESVAWLSQRKTLLAAFFALLCLVLYVYFVRCRHWRCWWGSLAMFVLSLLTKPTMVAMPILLLILDFWPLRRISRRAVVEKIPLFVIAGVWSVITFISQSSAASVKLPGEGGLVRGLLILCHNIVFYLQKFVWPLNLSWYYPFPVPFDLSQCAVVAGVIGTIALVVILMISLWWTRCMITGWLFFFAAIFPTLGLIGFHPMIAADRHIYFPAIGFMLVVGWTFSQLLAGEFVKVGKAARRIILVSAVVILGGSEFYFTRHYLSYWRDTESVYKYMLSMSPDVAILHNNLGNVLKGAGKIEEAIGHFEVSLKLSPNSPQIHNNLGNSLSELGNIDDAIAHYRKAISLKPDFAVAHYNLAAALAQKGKCDEAITEYREAVRLQDDYVEALNNLAFELAKKGELNESLTCYKKAIAFEPGNVIAHGRLGMVLAEVGKNEEAIAEFRFVLKRRPKDVEMFCNVGIMLMRQGKIDEAIKQYRKVLQIDAGYDKARELLEEALAEKQRR